MSVLLDSSVAIALLISDHDAHDATERWLAGLDGTYATCPVTQGAVVRHTLRLGRSADSAVRALRSLVAPENHEFWPDDVGYPDVRLEGVIGHRQVTDAYLAQLARRRGGRVATLDQGMAALHADVAELVPTS